MAHTLTTHLGQCHFDTTLFADHPAMLQALIFSAQALIVFYRPENSCTKKTVALRFERTIVNGFWLFNFTKGPRTDHFWRRQPDTQRVKFLNVALGFQQIK